MINLEKSTTPINNTVFKLIVNQFKTLSFAKNNVNFVELTVAEINILLVLIEEEVVVSVFQDGLFTYHANVGILTVPLEIYELTKEFFDTKLESKENYEYEHEDEVVEIYNSFSFNILDVLFKKFIWKFVDIQIYNRFVIAFNFNEFMSNRTPQELGIPKGRLSEFFEEI